MGRGKLGISAKVGVCFLLLSFVIFPVAPNISFAADKKLPVNTGEAAGSGSTQVAQAAPAGAAAGAAGAGEAAAGAAAAGTIAGISATTWAVIGGVAAAIVIGAAAAGEDEGAAAVHH